MFVCLCVCVSVCVCFFCVYRWYTIEFLSSFIGAGHCVCVCVCVCIGEVFCDWWYSITFNWKLLFTFFSVCLSVWLFVCLCVCVFLSVYACVCVSVCVCVYIICSVHCRLEFLYEVFFFCLKLCCRQSDMLALFWTSHSNICIVV